ncbi:MAG: hypothetical protein EZS28_031341, partial [Streblomastix strix]
VLRAYGALLRDIYREDDTALMMFNEANAIEEELASGGGNYDEQQSYVSGISGQSKGNRRKGTKVVGHSQKSGLDGQSIEYKKKRRERRRTIVMACMLVNIVALVVNFVLVQVTFTDGATTVNVINKLTDMMVQSNELLLYSRFFFIYVRVESSLHDDITGVACLPTKDDVHTVLHDVSKTVDECLIFAYSHTRNSNEFTIWEYQNVPEVHILQQVDEKTYPDNTLEVFRRIQDEPDLWLSETNTISLVYSVSNIANEMQSPTFNIEKEMTWSWIYFLPLNVPLTEVEAVKQMYHTYNTNSEKSGIQSVIISVVIAAVAMIMPLILDVSQFVLTITKLKRERHKVFLKLCLTPKEKINRLRKRLEDVDKEAEIDENITVGSKTDTLEDIQELQNEAEADANNDGNGKQQDHSIQNEKEQIAPLQQEG